MENKKKEQIDEEFNIYHLWIEDSGYEQYDGFVVISKNLENAKEFIISEYNEDVLHSWNRYNIKNRCIGISRLKEQVVLGSFIRA